jgi:purine-binding chemotaxis protein CheW
MPSLDRAASALPHEHAAAGKYLTFSLDRESYGLPVLRVREIIRLTDITPVPQMPPHIRGVINLRGKIIPVVDLRVRFGFPPALPSERTCIVVVQVAGGLGGQMQLGLIVDDVQEVTQISGADIEETPDFDAQVNTDCILGIAKLKGRVAVLLDIDKALSAESTAVEAPSGA